MIDDQKSNQLMRHIKGFVRYSLGIGIVAISFIGISCKNGGTKPDYTVAQELKVKTHSDNAIFSKEPSESGSGLDCEFEAEVDLPIDGPKALTDSIRRLVTKEMYRMFDLEGGCVFTEDELHIPFEELLCKWNSKNIFRDFVKYYRPLYEKCATEAGVNSQTLKLVSQAETFVTYYEEKNYCAASCNHEYKYYTFRKTDGYLLEEVISDINLKKLVKKYPQYENDGDYYVPFMGLSDHGLLYGVYVATGAFRGENLIDKFPIRLLGLILTRRSKN